MLKEVREITNQLAAIDKCISDEDIIENVLNSLLELYEEFVSSFIYCENAPSFVVLTSFLLYDEICRELRNNRCQQVELLTAKGKISYRCGGRATTDVKSGNIGWKLLNKDVYCHWCGSPEHLLRVCPDFKVELTKRATERNKKNIKALAVTKNSDSDGSNEQFFYDDFAADFDSLEEVVLYLVNLD